MERSRPAAQGSYGSQAEAIPTRIEFVSHITAYWVVPISCVIGLIYAYCCYKFVSKVRVKPVVKARQQLDDESEVRQTIDLAQEEKEDGEASTVPTPRDTTDVEAAAAMPIDVDATETQKIFEIYQLIRDGATSFLWAEYKYLAVFIVGFSLIICTAISYGCGHRNYGLFAAFSFFVGAITSIICGYIGMRVATYSNARTAIRAKTSLAEGFHVAFSGGSVMGFSLVSLGLIVLYSVFMICINYWVLVEAQHEIDDRPQQFHEVLQNCMRSLAGFGIGASSVALFARVGGGIYTKAADVGADLVGKIEAGIPEDDPRNLATIADNVGDNVGDIAGMGA
eukprot:258559_1